MWNEIDFSFPGQLGSLDFWQSLLAAFQATGPMAAISLAMIESIVPALPLTAIAVLNVAAHGFLWGFLFTWIGSCAGCTITFLFFRYVYGLLSQHFNVKKEKIEKARKWISEFDSAALFLILCLPFTPSSFMNFAFGISDFPKRKYLLTLYAAKVLMIGSLALFGDGVVRFWENPLRLILGLGLMAGLYIFSLWIRKKHKL